MADSTPTGTADASLSDHLSREILRLVLEDEMSVGDRLTERALAERLKVSRSPVRRALAQLHANGLVARTDTGRYALAPPAVDRRERIPRADAPMDETYLRVAEDRLDGRLPQRVTEALLAREYGLTRAQVNDLLMRISREAWIQRLPGRGWEFLPVLTSMQGYVDSFRFRLLVEPAAIMEPTFELDREALLARRAEQEELRGGRLHDIPAPALFDLNSAVHETVAACGRNSILLDSVVRVNRLRRLIEYRQAVDRDRARELCGEHIELIDLLLAGENEAAQIFLRQHLITVRRDKTRDSDRLLQRATVTS